MPDVVLLSPPTSDFVSAAAFQKIFISFVLYISMKCVKYAKIYFLLTFTTRVKVCQLHDEILYVFF
jgi:hypothetical protein